MAERLEVPAEDVILRVDVVEVGGDVEAGRVVGRMLRAAVKEVSLGDLGTSG